MANKIKCFVCIVLVTLCVFESMGLPIDTSGSANIIPEFCNGEIHPFDFIKQYICQTYDKGGSLQGKSDPCTDMTGIWWC